MAGFIPAFLLVVLMMRKKFNGSSDSDGASS